MMTSYCVLGMENRNIEMCNSLDEAFIKSLAEFGDLDEEIFSNFYVKRFLKYSQSFKEYYPNSFKLMHRYVKNNNSISFQICREIVNTRYFVDIP